MEDILGLNSESDDTQNTGKSDCSWIRHFSLNSKQDSQGIALLKDGESIVTSNVSGVQTGLNLLTPAALQRKVLPMPDIDISVSGVLKLLTGLNPSKAAGPDTIKPVVLRELANEIIPIVTAIFQLSMDTGTVPPEWKQALVTPLF